MSVRVTAAAQFVSEDGVAVTTAARVLGVSRQAVYDRLAPPTHAVGQVVEQSAELRLVPPVLPYGEGTGGEGGTAAAGGAAVAGAATNCVGAGYWRWLRL